MLIFKSYFIFFLLVLSLFNPNRSEARVFLLKDELVNSYFKGNISSNSLGSKSFDGTSAAAVEYDTSDSLYLYGGEVGLTLTGEMLGARLGFEYLTTSAMTAKGIHSSGVEYYQVESQVRAMIPKLALDLHLKRWEKSRIILSIEVGQATVEVQNAFLMTQAGAGALGLSDFTEKSSAKSLYSGYRLGYERHFTDRTTILLDIGFRNLKTDGLKVTNNHTGFDGAVSEGDSLKVPEGNSRRLTLTGLNIGLGFRFYL